MKSYDYLISYNIKPSVQRIAIMDYLLAHKTHPSIDEIYLALCKDIPTLSKTTVYNTLKLFVEHGAALMLTIDEKNACFDGDTSLHAHFLCKKCGKIFDLPYSNEVKKVEQIDMNGFKVDEIHQYYKGYNIKPSVQRIAIMDYLLAHKTHPSIDEIYLALCKDIPTLSKTTVYNTLKLFVEHGAALMLTIDEKNACFDGDTSLHAHFLCKKCGKIFDLPYSNEVKKVEQIDMNGFKVDEIHQYYKGICPACSKED